MFTSLAITAFVALFTVFAVTISAFAQCSKKKPPANAAAPSSGAKTDAEKREGGSVATGPSLANNPQPTPPGDAAAVGADPKSVEAPKSCGKLLDKTQTQDGKTGEGNEGVKVGTERSKDEEDTFEQHKPVPREAKRAKEIVSKPSIPKNRDDYKTFNKKNMPESDFDKTMSGVQNN